VTEKRRELAVETLTAPGLREMMRFTRIDLAPLMMPQNFSQLETDLNAAMEKSCSEILSSESKTAYYAGLFDRSSEAGFYNSPAGPKGDGEKPDWQPNPAYMDSLEEMWLPAEALLRESGLTLEKTLRELFFQSREYRDRAADHRRVFVGQMVESESGRPVTCFMLNIPHSHDGFRYLTAPRIQIAPSL
jgi:hypothetical protein